VSITAIFHDRKSDGEISVWEVRGHQLQTNQTISEQIPSLIEDLAFQITHSLGKIRSQEPEIYPRNWTSFKDLVLARDAYKTYIVNDNIAYLDKSLDSVLLANESEPDYKGPLRQSILYDLGFAYLYEGKYNESEQVFQNLSALKPEVGYFGLGLVYYKENSYEKALSYINRVIVMNPNNAYALLIKGIILNSKRDYVNAQESLSKANKLNSSIEFAWFLEGVNSFQQHNMNEALDCFNKCIELNSKNSWALFSKGRIIRDRDPEAALDLFNKTIKFDPSNAYAWNERGNCLYLKGNLNEALEAKDIALELSPTSWNIWNDKGLILRDMNLSAEAEKCLVNATKLRLLMKPT
jgi:tetratricopeptide (TPR) repeat protein